MASGSRAHSSVWQSTVPLSRVSSVQIGVGVRLFGMGPSGKKFCTQYKAGAIWSMAPSSALSTVWSVHLTDNEKVGGSNPPERTPPVVNGVGGSSKYESRE